MHSQTRSFRGSPVGIGLAIFATITLILTLASVVRPSPVTAQGGDDAALNIFKLVEGTTTRLPGAVFEVDGLDGTFTSDENGQICITGLPDDAEYLVREIEAPDGYQIIEPEQTVEVDNDGDCDSPDARFYNRPTDEGEGGGEEETVSVSIMKHLCDDVSSVAEFEAVESAGAGGQPGGIGTISALVATVLACPTIVLTGDVPTDGAITNGNVDFDFSVVDAGGTRMLSTDGTFEQQALCEDDVMLDANGDGTIEADVCLDTSHYMFEVVDGAVVVTETADPEGSTGLGTIRFTPASEDETALTTSIDEVEATGVITLDISTASETSLSDGMIMIHAYNFAFVDQDVDEDEDGESPDAGGSGPTGEGTLGGNPVGAGGLPDTATPSVTESLPAALLALLVIAGLGWTVRVNLAAVRARSR